MLLPSLTSAGRVCESLEGCGRAVVQTGMNVWHRRLVCAGAQLCDTTSTITTSVGRWWEGVQVCVVTECRKVTAGVSVYGGTSAYLTCGTLNVIQHNDAIVVQYVSMLLVFVHGYCCGFGNWMDACTTTGWHVLVQSSEQWQQCVL